MEPQQWRVESLENEKVKLKLLGEDDFEVLYQVAADPAVWVEHPISDRYKREVFQAYFEQAIASTAAFLVIDKLTNQIIGCTQFHDYSPPDSSVAIGFTFLSRAFWGKKYNLSSKRLLLEFAFQFVNKVYFLAGASNFRPQMTLVKLGARLDGEVNFKNGDKNIRQFRYVIYKADWRIPSSRMWNND